jgi:beta-phosphoglucomutase-like phosphatase (HAD superfamily)
LDAELTSIELAAVAHATVPGYVHEALAACRDSGRASAVIGRQSAEAVRTYLAGHGLSDQTACVIATGSYPPGHLQTLAHLVEDAIGELSATPAECALITASAAGIDAAHGVGAQVIGYARTPADREHLAQAGATCIIPSLADLTLRLRARPLPN